MNKLPSYHDIRGRNISMDRLYSSFSVANWFFEKGVRMVGTMNKNRVGIPKAIHDINNRELNSSEIHLEENGKRNITSYVVKTSEGKKFIVLSTLEPLLGVTSDDEKCKPAIIKLYDFSKGGTDIVDQKDRILYHKKKIS